MELIKETDQVGKNDFVVNIGVCFVDLSEEDSPFDWMFSLYLKDMKNVRKVDLMSESDP